MHSRWSRIALIIALLGIFPALAGGAGEGARSGEVQPIAPAATVASTACEACCSALAAQLEEQNRKISHELRLIKRDLTLLNQNLEKPGLREIMAGVGYILGLFGIAAFVAARRQKPRARGN